MEKEIHPNPIKVLRAALTLFGNCVKKWINVKRKQHRIFPKLHFLSWYKSHCVLLIYYTVLPQINMAAFMLKNYYNRSWLWWWLGFAKRSKPTGLKVLLLVGFYKSEDERVLFAYASDAKWCWYLVWVDLHI